MQPSPTTLLQGALALLLAAFASAGLAADAPAAQACQADVRKLCPGARPGGGRVLGCLKEREAELSADCKAALPALQRCAQEVKTVCGSQGRRELRECLRSKSDQFSAECRVQP
jgi:Cysteine rich repeat